MTTNPAQRVVVIQDASREVSSSAIAWIRQGLNLKPGDKLTLLAVVHQVINPSTLSFKGAGKLLGYKSKVDSSMFGSNQKIVVEEVTRISEEYQNNAQLMKIVECYSMDKIEFKIEVTVGSSPKVVALQASKNLRATWVILDRLVASQAYSFTGDIPSNQVETAKASVGTNIQIIDDEPNASQLQMKKDKKYFMERLSCGISRMKRDNTVEKLRGPRTMAIKKKVPTEAIRPSNVTYEEMLPGTPDEEDLFSLEFSPTSSTTSPSKKISGEVQRADADGLPEKNNSQQVTSFSKSKSADHLILKKTVSSSSLGNTEATNSSLNEEQYSKSHHEDEENSTKTDKEMVEVRSPNLTSADIAQRPLNEIDIQDQDWIVWQTNEESMTPGGLTGWHPEEARENSTCSVCKNIRPMIGRQKDFSYAVLQAATKGFSAKAFLSTGGFGHVFKGKLRDGLEIAIKQLKDGSLQGEKEFKTELEILSKARHRNVVMLLGSCSEGSHRMLVYEFVCNGSLDQHISRNSHSPLSWTDRVKIALGAARGLNYLHTNNIVHRDMRPDNILVNHDLEPLLGDFGLARTQSEESNDASDNRVVGTPGYLAPEYAESGKVTTKADVYSFGVILLELITGIRTTDNNLGEKCLVGWAKPLLKERQYPDLIDNRIEDAHDVHQLFGMVQLAEKCLTEDPEKRLSMDKVVNALLCISNGETISSIVGLSPTHSDSFSIPESSESQGDEAMMEQNNHNTNRHSVGSTSQMSGLFSSESSAYTYSTKSSSSSTSSKKSISSRQKTDNHKKEAVKSRTRYQVPYGEMLS